MEVATTTKNVDEMLEDFLNQSMMRDKIQKVSGGQYLIYGMQKVNLRCVNGFLVGTSFIYLVYHHHNII